jgi:hypothetical protein
VVHNGRSGSTTSIITNEEDGRVVLRGEPVEVEETSLLLESSCGKRLVQSGSVASGRG